MVKSYKLGYGGGNFFKNLIKSGEVGKLGSDGKLENIGVYKLDRPIENIGVVVCIN